MWERLENWFKTLTPNTKKKYQGVFNEFIRFCKIEKNQNGAELLLRTDMDAINQFVNWCKTRPAQPGRSHKASGKQGKVSLGTVKQKITALHSVFEELRDQKQIVENPCSRALIALKRHKGNDRRPHRSIPLEKVSELFSLDLNKYDKAILACLFGAALRRSECLNLRICDVVEETDGEMYLTLTNTKAQKTECQYVLPDMANHIREWKVVRLKETDFDEDLLFPMYIAGKPQARPIDERTLLRWFKSWMMRVRLSPDYSCHDARKTSITLMLRQGLSVKQVQRFARHATPAMTLHYWQVDDDEYLKAVSGIKLFGRR